MVEGKKILVVGLANKYSIAAAIAETYLQFHRQDRSSWAWEIELRPWVETF